MSENHTNTKFNIISFLKKAVAVGASDVHLQVDEHPAIRIDGKITGDLLVAGADVIINGEVTDDVRAVAANVTINGQVGKNVSVGGGNVIMSPSSQVGASLVGGGGTFEMASLVGGNAWVGGGNINFQGHVNQDLNLGAEQTNFVPGSIVGGNLMAKITEGGLVDDQVVVAGNKKIDFTRDEARERQMNKQQMAKTVSKAMVMQWLFGLLISVASASVMLHFFKNLSNSLANQVKSSVVGNLGWGLIILVTTPILVIFLMCTILGLPLAFIVLLAYIMALIVASWITGYALGQWLAEKSKIAALKNPYLQLIAGLFTLKLVGVIPVAGWLMGFGATLIGLGVLWLSVKAQLNKSKTKKE